MNPTQPSILPFEIIHEIAKTKELRRDIDAILTRVNALPKGRYTALAATELEMAGMWLGKSLQRINEQYPQECPNPYPESKNPESLKIEPAADKQDLSEAMTVLNQQADAAENHAAVYMKNNCPDSAALNKKVAGQLRAAIAVLRLHAAPTEPSH